MKTTSCSRTRGLCVALVLTVTLGGVIGCQRGAGDLGDAMEEPPTDGGAAAPVAVPAPTAAKKMSGNPVFPGWYADPEAAVFGKTFWIYPTYSAGYGKQTFFDAFSSPDLVTWTKHERILTGGGDGAVKWMKRAAWAPSVVEKDGKYYFFFAANDIQKDGEEGGIGVAVSDKPEGPFADHIGRPLIDRFHNGAQPIDQFVFRDGDDASSQWYIIYGGWKHCNIARLSADFKSIKPFTDGTMFKEITPDKYVEGPYMLRRKVGDKLVYYFMWSEGGWTGPNYSVAYAMADNVMGPFKRVGKILQQDAAVATGAGHHSVIRVHGREGKRDEYVIVYHRRPLGDTDGNHRVVCIDRMEFAEDGTIKPVRITMEGVEGVRLPSTPATQP